MRGNIALGKRVAVGGGRGLLPLPPREGLRERVEKGVVGRLPKPAENADSAPQRPQDYAEDAQGSERRPNPTNHPRRARPRSGMFERIRVPIHTLANPQEVWLSQIDLLKPKQTPNAR